MSRKHLKVTRKHSSRMHAVGGVLPASGSGCLLGEAGQPRGCLPGEGVCLPGVSAQGGCLHRGGACWGVSMRGCLPWDGGCLPRGVLACGVYPSMH